MDDIMVQYAVRSFRGNRTTLKFGPPDLHRRHLYSRCFAVAAAIDYSHTKGMYAGKSQLGIYECDGQTLQLSLSPPGQPRPTDFEEHHTNTVSVLRGGDGRAACRPAYWYRSATTGEMRVARSAGTNVASSTTNINPSGAAVNVNPSVMPMPNSIVLSNRVSKTPNSGAEPPPPSPDRGRWTRSA